MVSTSAPASSRSALAIPRLVALVLILFSIGITLAIIGTSGTLDLLTDVGESKWGFAAFVSVYALAVVLLLPGTLGTLTAGAVFGFPVGAAAALVGATIGANADTDLKRSGLRRAMVRAPWPPMECPEIELRSGLTGKCSVINVGNSSEI